MSINRSKIYTREIPLVTMEFYSHLNGAFPKRPITPSTDLPSVYYQAGQRSVVDFVHTCSVGHLLSGDPKLLIKPQKLSWIQRLFQGVK